MKLAIVGSRTFDDRKLLEQNVAPLKPTQIISGGAKGADALGKQYAEDNDIEYIEYPAEWKKYGRSAGMIRNSSIVDACDTLIAFWDGQSKGTKDSIKKAGIANKPVILVTFRAEDE